MLAEALGAERPIPVPPQVNLTAVAALARSIPCCTSRNGFKNYNVQSSNPLAMQQSMQSVIAHVVYSEQDGTLKASCWGNFGIDSHGLQNLQICPTTQGSILAFSIRALALSMNSIFHRRVFPCFFDAVISVGCDRTCQVVRRSDGSLDRLLALTSSIASSPEASALSQQPTVSGATIW